MCFYILILQAVLFLLLVVCVLCVYLIFGVFVCIYDFTCVVIVVALHLCVVFYIYFVKLTCVLVTSFVYFTGLGCVWCDCVGCVCDLLHLFTFPFVCVHEAFFLSSMLCVCGDFLHIHVYSTFDMMCVVCVFLFCVCVISDCVCV